MPRKGRLTEADAVPRQTELGPCAQAGEFYLHFGGLHCARGHLPEILDQPVAGLIRDLKQRGLLESTLVVFCTEFGRMPMFQLGTYGRDHNPFGFTCWFAGAGVRAPFSFGINIPAKNPNNLFGKNALNLNLNL